MTKNQRSFLAAAARCVLDGLDPDGEDTACALDTLLALLVETQSATPEELENAWLEPECAEHGVVHIQAEGADGDFWIEVDQHGRVIRI